MTIKFTPMQRVTLESILDQHSIELDVRERVPEDGGEEWSCFATYQGVEHDLADEWHMDEIASTSLEALQLLCYYLSGLIRELGDLELNCESMIVTYEPKG